jgi:hypothetical protein
MVRRIKNEICDFGTLQAALKVFFGKNM